MQYLLSASEPTPVNNPFMFEEGPVNFSDDNANDEGDNDNDEGDETVYNSLY